MILAKTLFSFEFILLLACLSVFFLAFLIINIIKNRQLHKLVDDFGISYGSNEFIIRIDASNKNWKITIYSRSSHLKKKNFTLEEYLNTIFNLDQSIFQDYVANCLKDKKLPKLTLRHTAYPLTIKMGRANSFRREYFPLVYQDDRIYFRCHDFTIEKKKNQKMIISNLGEFRKQVKALTKEENVVQGVMFAFNVFNRDKILSRYNIGILRQYDEVINQKINEFAVSRGILVAHDDDVYYFYADKLINRKEAISFLKQFKQYIEVPIMISHFKLSVINNYGVAFFGEFSSTVETVISQSEQAMEEAINYGLLIDSFVYDESLEQENIKKRKNYEKVGRMINSRSFSPLYSPIVNLKTFKSIGQRIIFRPDSHFLTLEEIHGHAKDINLLAALNDSLANTVFSHFYFKKISGKDIIYIETTMDEIHSYIDVYKKNNDYISIPLAFVLTDYAQLRYRDLNLKIIQDIKTYNILLYAIADQEMLFSNHPIFNYLNGIIFNQQILNRIELDSVFRLEMIKINDRFQEYNYNYLAYDVDKSSKLEIVSSLGIDLIEGKIIQDPTANPLEVDSNAFRKKIRK